ncbi:exosortase E/protease, VPEID-CTERM system [uncultured Paracoccus sp.]|uniref:exosortase E/protease, VPEID-CTERM system n=1 Tax=uncultured Paracoccus sp. TaxID=189685 RepID=UPI00261C8812|nr:exosortase E/protease, VPEID-CTERM system [uncultured Paracoccus sp.]
MPRSVPVGELSFLAIGWRRLVVFGAVLLGELLVVAFCYQFLIDIECAGFTQPQACFAVREGFSRLLSLALLFGLLIAARPHLFGYIARGRARASRMSHVATLGAMLVGLALMLLPVLWRDLTTSLTPLALALAAGAGISVTAALIGTAPLGCWLSVLRRGGPWLWLAIGIALLSPELTQLLNGAWGWPPLTAATFALVVRALAFFPGELFSDPGGLVIGFEGFLVHVGAPCSGLQGFALITLVMVGFIALEQRRLRLPLALILLPVGLLASFALNVLRIALLIWIGARISPDLAVNAFHSYAGWLLFTLLSLGMIGATYLTPVLWRSQAASAGLAPPVPSTTFRNDLVTAMLMPLVVLLLSGLFASTFFVQPETAYPLRVPAMFVGLALFHSVWSALDWRTDLLPPVVGVAVGFVWIAAAVAAGIDAPDPPFAGLGLAAAAIWVVLRLIGTVLLVPLIEEAAFRGYLLGHLLKPSGSAGRACAALVSATAFAFLHDSGVAAFVSGLVFAAIYLRRGRLADAVWAHAAANLVVFGAAAVTGKWGLI